MYCKSAKSLLNSRSTSSVSFRATAHGAASQNGIYSNIIYNSKASPTYTMTEGKQQYMINYIKEAGGKYANIYCQPGTGGYLKFMGYWSPDSE